ncbi:hypothetical protein GCM10023322_67050 [Rugosimonospora acidiphila]|uniref:Uncharacterized protein n=1 Tax=Rugosimonospora acidiphila TaxID=556531 RepID=A0ABP9SKK9_9ACTN
MVIAFGNPAYTDWVRDNTSNDAWGYFLRQLAWPKWSFSSDESVRTILADDLKAILLVVLTGLFVTLLAGSQLSRARGSASQFFAGWGAYMFAGAVAGLIAAFVQANASLLGAFNWASGGAVYGLFVGWIVGLAAFGARR